METYWRCLKRHQRPQSNESITMEYNRRIPERVKAGKQRNRSIKKGCQEPILDIHVYSRERRMHGTSVKVQAMAFWGLTLIRHTWRCVFESERRGDLIRREQEDKGRSSTKKMRKGAKYGQRNVSRQTWSALRWWSSEKKRVLEARRDEASVRKVLERTRTSASKVKTRIIEAAAVRERAQSRRREETERSSAEEIRGAYEAWLVCRRSGRNIFTRWIV